MEKDQRKRGKGLGFETTLFCRREGKRKRWQKVRDKEKLWRAVYTYSRDSVEEGSGM